MKKTASTPTTPRRNLASPPVNLKPTGRVLWQTIIDEFQIDDSGSRALLHEACKAADRAEECSRIIDKEGLIVATKMGTAAHPLVKSELLLRSFVTGTLIRLGVVDSPRNPPGRPLHGGLGVTDAYTTRHNGREDA
jgi:hypothetical protein